MRAAQLVVHEVHHGTLGLSRLVEQARLIACCEHQTRDGRIEGEERRLEGRDIPDHDIFGHGALEPRRHTRIVQSLSLRG